MGKVAPFVTGMIAAIAVSGCGASAVTRKAPTTGSVGVLPQRVALAAVKSSGPAPLKGVLVHADTASGRLACDDWIRRSGEQGFLLAEFDTTAAAVTAWDKKQLGGQLRDVSVSPWRALRPATHEILCDVEGEWAISMAAPPAGASQAIPVLVGEMVLGDDGSVGTVAWVGVTSAVERPSG